jgi:hypothetical protein
MLTIQFEGEPIQIDLERNAMPVLDVDRVNGNWCLVDEDSALVVFICPNGWTEKDARNLAKAIKGQA